MTCCFLSFSCWLRWIIVIWFRSRNDWLIGQLGNHYSSNGLSIQPRFFDKLMGWKWQNVCRNDAYWTIVRSLTTFFGYWYWKLKMNLKWNVWSIGPLVRGWSDCLLIGWNGWHVCGWNVMYHGFGFDDLICFCFFHKYGSGTIWQYDSMTVWCTNDFQFLIVYCLSFVASWHFHEHHWHCQLSSESFIIHPRTRALNLLTIQSFPPSLPTWIWN